MIDTAIFIPAQERNQYHELGDLAPFGDTSLLNWKISQCKEFVSPGQIFISSSSSKIQKIVDKEDVNFIKRESDKINITSQIESFAKNIDFERILWTNATSPFLGGSDYQSMLNKFFAHKSCKLMITTVEKKEYTFYDNRKLNFQEILPRNNLKPINISSNGAYLIDKKSLLNSKKIQNIKDICFYNLDNLSAIEIKDIDSYSTAQNLISTYFSRMFGNKDHV